MSEAVHERRKKARHRASILQVTLSKSGFSLLNKPIAVKCMDYNRYGMTVISPKKIATGKKLKIDFKTKYVDEKGILGVVETCKQELGVYRLGVAFLYAINRKHYSREIDNMLSKIEGLMYREELDTQLLDMESQLIRLDADSDQT